MKHTFRRRAALAVALALASSTALAACSSSASGTGSSCVARTLLIASETGGSASAGIAAVAGAKAAVDYANAHGGADGCQIVLDVKDDGSDFTKNLPLTQAAMASQKYVMVSGADFGAVSMAPYLTREGVLGMFSNGTKGLPDPKTNPYLFDACIPSADVANALAQYVVNTDGKKKIALVVDNTAVGQSNIDAITPVVKAAGGEIVDTEKVDLSSINMTPAVQRAQAAAPDALIVNLFGTAGGYFFRDLNASGWKVPTYGPQSVFATNLAKTFPVNQLGDLKIAGPALGTQPAISPAVTDFVSELKAEGDPVDKPLQLYAQVHDAFTMFAWAANGSHSLDTKTITKYLEDNGNTPVPQLTFATTTNYSPTNHEWHPKQGIAIATISKLTDGQYDNRISRIDG